MPTRTYECEECNSSFTRRSEGRDSGRFCSRACGYARQRKNAAIIRQNKEDERQIRLGANAFEYMQNKALKKAIDKQKLYRLFMLRSGPCRCCGESIDYKHGGRPPTLCSSCRGTSRAMLESSRSLARAREARRKRLVYSEPYLREDVFEAFDWKCYICDTPTPRELMGRNTNAPNEPTIDHMTPISRGGSDAPGNIACCCRACNVSKGAMTHMEFLMLPDEVPAHWV